MKPIEFAMKLLAINGGDIKAANRVIDETDDQKAAYDKLMSMNADIERASDAEYNAGFYRKHPRPHYDGKEWEK